MSVKESQTQLFNQETHYVLFSGTGKDGNGPIRHLNDLFIILYLLNKNQIPKENIFLSIDVNILSDLDEITNYKTFKYFDNGRKTFKEVIAQYVAPSNIINIFDFKEKYDRNGNDLVFIASGHGSISGLEMGDEKYYDTLSSDYFEEISTDSNKTILIMSQCQAAAFHH